MEGFRREADAEFCDPVGGESAAGEVFARRRAFGGAQLLFEPGSRGFVQLEKLAALAMLGGFFGRSEFALGEGDAGLLRDGADGFRESDVLDFLDEGEDVAMLVAAEAVEELAAGVDREGRGFFFVEGAEPGKVLRAGFFQAHVFPDDLDDVGLFFDVLGEIGGHGRRGSGYRVQRQLGGGVSCHG